MSFGDDIRKICDATNLKMHDMCKKVAIDVTSGVVDRSPVDTGRFRGNWMVATGSADTATTASTTASDSINRALNMPFNVGQSIFITNSLPYAQRLENGWSQQAPQGMVALTVQDYANTVRKVVEALK